ncbi:TetR/AcrR family transcriptional regulator [Microtetraspora malaysiensis]|uniref:TetR/AcrR family transcriptional regulator n=1 Tax=Microtetraspora malaysiensis TaxID=161358 RepID=UPI003D8DA5CE
MSSSHRLPRGRNALPPEEVDRQQRERLCRAMAEVIAQKGYAATSVEDVLKHARVSRLSFYRLFGSKLDCFMAAFDHACELLFAQVMGAIETFDKSGDLMEGYERAITAYLEALEAEWPYTRIYLVEVYAAGSEAVAHRRELNEFMTSFYADALGVIDDQGLLTCRMLVAATSALVTVPVAENDPEGLRAVAPQLIAHVRTLWDCGAFGVGTGRA